MKATRRQTAAFLLPWLVGVVALTVYPLAATVMLSFTSQTGSKATHPVGWVGWKNYRSTLGVRLIAATLALDPSPPAGTLLGEVPGT